MIMRLHCFGESGNAYKCALMLSLTGQPWEPVFVDFFHGGTRTPAFRALNPMGEVPVLEDGAQVLTQSGTILLLAERTRRFGGATPEEAREVLRWLFWDNHKMSTVCGTVRFLSNFLPPDKRPEGAIPFLRGRLTAAFKVLDTHLSDRDWIAGDGPTIADLSACAYLFYPEPFGFDRADWPALNRWLDRIAALPGWKHPYDLMPGNPSDRAAQGGPHV